MLKFPIVMFVPTKRYQTCTDSSRLIANLSIIFFRGDKFAFGHHYLRPHETYHEPTRKFFHNEVMRVPLYEVVPLDLIMNHCWVLDVNTYCKGTL